MRSRSLIGGMTFFVFCGVAAFAGADCPSLAGRWPYAPVQTVTASGTTAYLGSGSTLVILDISNPGSPAVLGSLALPASINAIAISGGFAYVADGAAGLRVVNVSNPAQPVEVGHADGVAYAVAAAGARVYVGSDILRIYDASNPAAPLQQGAWTGRGNIRWLALSGAFAYVAWDYSPGYAWAAVGVSDPANPVKLFQDDQFGLDAPSPAGLETVGNLLFLALSGNSGASLVIWDVSNPSAPLGLGGFGNAEGTAIATSGAFSFLGEIRQLSVLSISDPRNPSLVTSVPLTFSPTSIAIAGHTVLVADQEAGLYLFDTSGCGVSGCSVSATSVVPRAAVASAPVAFQGTYLQSGCAGSATFDWDFGDGSAHSSEANPSHTYPYGGTFRWSLTVTLGGASASTSGTIAIASTLAPITSPGAYVYVVPTSAHKDGFNGTHWLTDLVLTNPGFADTVARVYFIKGQRDNTETPARPAIVPLRRSLALTDAIASTFQQTATSGAILVGSDVPLIVTSRTYNDATTGTYGQFVRGAPIGEAFGQGAVGWLPGLAQSATDGVGFRTNIGIVNAGGKHVQIVVDLYGGDGVWLGNKTVNLNPYDFQQLDKVYAGLSASGVATGYALVSTATPGAVLFAYASVIDNATGDPIAVPATAVPVGP